MIVCLGDAVVDLVALGLRALPAWGEDREVAGIGMQLGGSALHVAANLAGLGNEVSLLAGVGTDPWGRFLIDGARRTGVQVDGVRELDTSTAVTMVLSGKEDRAFVSVYGATERYGAEDLDSEVLARARHLHVTGLWQGRALLPHLATLFDTLRADGVTISLDTQYDPDDQWGDPLPALLERVDLFFPNEIEAVRITQQPTPEAALEHLAARIPLVAMKLGALGAMVQRGPERLHLPAFAVEVVDTTGAGDAFNAGFLHGWLRGWPLEPSLRFANAAGALAVARIGASENPPPESTVRAFLAATE